MGTWRSTAPTGVTFGNRKTGQNLWNYYSAYPVEIWTARGTGDTFHVKISVTWAEGQNGSYRKEDDGIYWAVDGDKHNYAMPTAKGTQTKYYTGSMGAGGTVTIKISPSASLTNPAEVTSASIPAATYAVTYDANGGTDAPAAQTKTYNTALTLSSAEPTRDYYNFTGWNTKADGTGTSYAAGDTYTGNAALKLYAQWAIGYALSLSSANVTTPGNQVITVINGEGKEATLTIRDTNNTFLYAAINSIGTFSVPISKTWFDTAGNTTGLSMTVTATVAIDGTTLTDTFTVSAGSDMMPVIESVTLSPVNTGNAGTYYPNTLISGVSRLKASVEASAPTNAALVTVQLKVPNETVTLTYNNVTERYEGTTSTVVTAGMLYAIYAEDARGLPALYGTNAVENIESYSSPVVTVDEAGTYRCDSNGDHNSTGAYYKAKATAVFTSLTGNSLLTFDVRLEGEALGNALTPGVQSGVLGGSMSSGDSYTLVFTAADKVSSATYRYTLKAPALAILISHGAGGTTVDLPEGGAYKIRGVSLLDIIYPVGSVYISSDSTPPATLFGGTWTQIEDVFLLAAGQIYTAGATGGEAAHTLLETEMPAHTHNTYYQEIAASGSARKAVAGDNSGTGTTEQNSGTTSVGGGEAHNNMPPYKAYYMWERTA